MREKIRRERKNHNIETSEEREQREICGEKERETESKRRRRRRRRRRRNLEIVEELRA